MEADVVDDNATCIVPPSDDALGGKWLSPYALHIHSSYLILAI